MATYNAKKLTIVKGSDTYIIDPMQGNETGYTTIPVTIAKNSWSGTPPYTYEWSNNHVTSNCKVMVSFMDGIRGGLVGDLWFTKATGKVTFVTDEPPVGEIPLSVTIIDGTVNGVFPIEADVVETDAVVGETTVQGALEDLDERVGELDERTEGGLVKTVNAIYPDENGEVRITKVAYSDNFTSDKTQNSEGEFIIRTAGGDASIADGDAFVMRVYGNRVHEGYVPESLSLDVTMAERVAPDPITAELDKDTFIAYVSDAGMYILTYTSGAWDETPGNYGVTVTGTPLDGDLITITWDGENDPVMIVVAPRIAPGPIAAYIDRDTFVAYVSVSGTTTLSYTTAWSANPALYGVTITGTPINGDSITITYVKEERGTIYVATPTALKSTGWNLYNHTAGYAYLTKYSTQYGFLIGGTYTELQYSATVSGEKSTITPVDGVFTIPDDGYVLVTGGDSTTTYIINQWSDWTDGPSGDFEPYSETTIDLSTVMSTYFPNGLLRVGVVRDEININTASAISKIERKAYSAENLAAAKASGRAYEYDTNYIYIVKASYDSNSIVLDGSYTASDHGNEFFVGSDIPVYLETMYGNNLKNKLERDVVTISQQSLTDNQQTQVRSNLNAASKDEVKPITITLNPVSNANGSYSNTTNNSLVSEDMKPVSIDVGTPETFKAPITITTGNGTVSLYCPDAIGSSTVQVTLIRTQPVDVGTSYPSITSTEFDILAGRVGSLSSLTTSDKTSLVAATNELNSKTAKVIKAQGISATSLEELKANLLSAVNSVDMTEFIGISFFAGFSESMITIDTTYSGYAYNIYKINGVTSYFSVALSNNMGEDLYIGYNSGNWHIYSLNRYIWPKKQIFVYNTGKKTFTINGLVLWGRYRITGIAEPANIDSFSLLVDVKDNGAVTTLPIVLGSGVTINTSTPYKLTITTQNNTNVDVYIEGNGFDSCKDITITY